MEDFAIKVENVSKTFKLPQEKQSSIKSIFINAFRSKKGYELQKALNDVSFEVKKGEFFGIVGRNGSGKSTLLKLLAGIYVPTTGQVHIRGSLTPFIELGVGFSPELTGRENVYLNGSLLGFSRKEMQKMYKDIVEFAELQKFMDQKLKNYSSGMQVRLAFSIAIRAQSDILLLDEVLAVGDEAFQRKCLDIFEQYKANKQTVVLVTHDMEMVRKFCSRALLLKDGDLVDIGSPHLIADKYSNLNQDVIDVKTEQANKIKPKPKHLKVSILNSQGEEKQSFNPGDKISVRVSWDTLKEDFESIGINIFKLSGEYITGVNTRDRNHTENWKKRGAINLDLECNIASGKYFLSTIIFKKPGIAIETYEGPEFLIKKGNKWSGLVELPYVWVEK